MNTGIRLLLLIPLFSLLSCGTPSYVFKDKKVLAQENVKLCLLGDLGLDTPVQKKIAAALEKERCDRIFFLGDLIYPSGIKSIHDPILEKKFLSYYDPLLKSNPELKINLMLGNHDYQGSPSAWLDLSQKNPGYFFPHYFYMMKYGGLCVTTFDTNLYVYSKYIFRAINQTFWLSRVNSLLKDCAIKISLAHHPYEGIKRSKQWKTSGVMKTILEEYILGKYDFHIAGHLHTLVDNGSLKGTRLLISGAGGETRDGGLAGYVVMNWNPKRPKKIHYYMQTID